MNNFKHRNALRFAGLCALTAGLAFASACKKSAPATPVPENSARLPMPAARQDEAATAAAKEAEMQRELEKRYPGKPAEQKATRDTMAALDAQADEEKKLAEINQRTMVLPAPADFKPEPVARKVRLTLLLEKTKIRAGENPRFRLELMNVGRESIDYQEYESSIFKGGSIGHSMQTISFFLTDRNGNSLDLIPASSWGRASPVQHHNAAPASEKKMLESSAKSAASTSFRVKLRPGETLRSLGDGDTVQEPFRTLRVEAGYGKPGTYQLQVKLDDRPRPLTSGYIKAALTFSTLEQIHAEHARRTKDALGPVSSNTVTFEVTR